MYGGLLAGLFGAYSFQPYEFDFIPRKIPNPNPPVDPDKNRLFAPGTKILVITAHPDDSEFYIAGSLSQLGKTAEIQQVICTDGDKGYYGPFTDSAENRRVRRMEATQAHEAWHGKGITFLGHPDGRLRANDELVTQLVDAIEKFKPEYVLAFDGEYPPRFSHQDHRRSGDAALAACKRCGVPKWCLLFSTIAPNFAIDITDIWDQKVALLSIHKSQWAQKMEGISGMVGALAEEDGTKFGLSLAEGYRCVKIR
ncbi:LmbE family protein [Fimbriimonas ginsengisoli Gsoil 348]|uniref:LmbE family protein n=1 Tax=Fimbriimonas ginsengisoli Gsoil 348 TaxID=661478 RepID=A0A068NPL3_FIMGI|nr:LmbE family protein [Fimbriimonas ginsengisoli Gsoil 348]